MDAGGGEMSAPTITFDEAYQRMQGAVRFLGAERVDLADALGRVLAQDARCDVDMPPFRKSAMDGFACRREDLEQELIVIETIAAGRMPIKTIGPGQCSRIMTGARVPDGADCVVMVEQTSQVAPDRIRAILPDLSMPDNICQQGEDVRAGDVVLQQGQVITAAHIAVLAAVGCVKPIVARLPRVSVLATGSELVEPADRPSGARIRNSNSYQLCAQLRSMGITANYLGIIPDDRSALDSAIDRASASSDVILLSGGVSEGAYDYVPDVLRTRGFAFHFQSVAMQPGRPTLFGDNGSAWCWGLPGNPVSTFVVFEILVKPFLYGLMGHTWRKQLFQARFTAAFNRRKADRQAAIPVRFSAPGEVTPIEYHGSAHIAAMVECDALLIVPIGQQSIDKGGVVYVRPL